VTFSNVCRDTSGGENEFFDLTGGGGKLAITVPGLTREQETGFGPLGSVRSIRNQPAICHKLYSRVASCYANTLADLKAQVLF
jgi:hypothetical protein